MSISCGDCLAYLDHCHGTLVRHGECEVSCTEGTCRDDDPLRHRLVLDCASPEISCECTQSRALATVG